MKTKLTLLLTLTLLLRAAAGVLPNDAVVGGRTQAEWSAEWWKWQWTASTNQNPFFDTNGVWASANQPDGDVFFLAGVSTISGTVSRSITVPEGKYLFFPLINSYCDNVDVFPPFTLEELRQCAESHVNATTGLHASLDGAAVTNLLAYRQISPVFSFVLEMADNFESWAAGHPVVGLVDPAVADGFYLMIEPLSPGNHVLNFGGSFGDVFQFSIDITDTITVVPMPLSERVQELISTVELAGLPPKTGKHLLKKLEAAQRSFAKGHLKSGIHQLQAFEHAVRKELERANPALAADLIQRAQRIVERAMSELSMTPMPGNSAGVLPNDAVVDGKTIGDWSAEWYKSFMACPTNDNPLRDLTGANALNCQPDGSVLFLAGVQFGDLRTATRAFTIPEGKHLFFPMLNVIAGDPADPPTIEERRDVAAAFIDNYTELHSSIDGVAVGNLEEHRAQSPVFSMELVSCDNMFTVNNGFCISGLLDNLVADGFYLMVEPLPVGVHVVNFGGTLGPPFNFAIDITETITVVPVPLAERVQELISRMVMAGLPAKTSKPLLKKLDEAERSFAKDHLKPGIHELQAFQHAVRKEFERSNPALADALIQAAQQIIDRARTQLP